MNQDVRVQAGGVSMQRWLGGAAGLAAFGVPPERLKELEKEFAERDAYIDQQLQEAAEAKAEKERNRTPESEAKRLAGLEKFKQQIEAHIERRDAEWAANPD